jgi:hypothetical protein
MVEFNVVNERDDNRWVGVTGPHIKLLRQAKCIEDATATQGHLEPHHHRRGSS